ncbi:helix-turn-helix domain-containing protein [Streptomyces sp. NPDC005955]|uniref:AraC-like ligand-binding domain-containing protein n=1 Tax=Streptomyces sp. NPDC005955 TaxID=3364738 RepID=UPI003675CD6D
MRSALSTGAMTGKERVELFRDAIARDVAPMRITVDAPDRFAARATQIALGPVRLADFRYSSLRSHRTPTLIRRSDPESYHLALVVDGSMQMALDGSDGHGTTLGRGDWVLFDTSHPFRYETVARADRPTRVSILQLPRHEVPLAQDRLDRLLGQRLPGDTGLGRVLRDYLSGVAAEIGSCTPCDLDHLGGAALDLAAAFLAHHLDGAAPPGRAVRARSLLRRVDAYIDLNLGDSRLNPATVAAAHGVSLRSLYLMFEERGEGVAALIRRRRLERCHAELVAGGPTPGIGAVATRWGFTSAGAFSRAFRARYGVSPREHRETRRPPAGGAP